MNDIIWIAFALFLVFEGLYRQLVQLISEREDKPMRIIGFSMMVLGTFIIYIVKL